MKLFTKYNRINVASSVVIFLAGSIAFYFVLHYILLKQLDDTLKTERAEIFQYVHEHNALPEIVNTNDQQIFFRETHATTMRDQYISEKTLNPAEKEIEWLRKLVFHIDVGQKHYEVLVQKSQLETEDLLKVIIFIAVTMIALIMAAGYVINRVIVKKIWRPFYHTIDHIKEYQLTQQPAFQLPPTGTDEFTLLNESVNVMTSRAQQEYETLKNFTGNAAHEMQTPLAVITTQTDALMQDETVLKDHAATIVTIEQAVNRLSRLNQSLLLLAKIENKRFDLNDMIDWQLLVQQKVNALRELITSQELELQIDTEPVSTIFHQYLADIIIGNLLNNSIRYNKPGGKIIVELHDKKLIVANTSELQELDMSMVFKRFFRHPQTQPEGNGLGLSIVKQLCDLGGYAIRYSFTKNLHVFSITFG